MPAITRDTAVIFFFLNGHDLEFLHRDNIATIS